MYNGNVIIYKDFRDGYGVMISGNIVDGKRDGEWRYESHYEYTGDDTYFSRYEMGIIQPLEVEDGYAAWRYCVPAGVSVGFGMPDGLPYREWNAHWSPGNAYWDNGICDYDVYETKELFFEQNKRTYGWAISNYNIWSF